MGWFSGSLSDKLSNKEEIIKSRRVYNGIIDQGSERRVSNLSIIDREEFLWWEFFNYNNCKFWFIVGVQVSEGFQNFL